MDGPLAAGARPAGIAGSLPSCKPKDHDSGVMKHCLDIVVPTMWRSDGFVDALVAYAGSASVGTIILIDNDSARRPPLPSVLRGRLLIIDHGRNIYVNPAWNEGVAVSDSEFLCILNDDICVDPRLFQIVLGLDFEKYGIDIIGVDLTATVAQTTLQRIAVDPRRSLGSQQSTFGACMLMPRRNYRRIPDGLKVWFGDDFLVRSSQGVYLMSTPLITGGMSATIRDLSEGDGIQAVIQQDIQWAHGHLLSSGTT